MPVETEVPFFDNPDFYAQATTEDAANLAVVVTAKVARAANLGDLYCAEAASCQEGVAMFKTDGKRVGVPLIYSADIATTAPNFTAQCLAAQQAHVQAIFMGAASSAEPLPIGVNCSQQGYHPTYLLQGEGMYKEDLSAPGLSEDLWAPYNDAPFWANTPAVQTMNAAVDKYYPGLRNNGSAWGESATESWVSGLLLEQAVKAGGLTAKATPSASEIIQGLNSLKGDTMDGMAPPLTFTAGQVHPVDCWFTTRTDNGVPSLVNGGKVTCLKGTP